MEGTPELQEGPIFQDGVAAALMAIEELRQELSKYPTISPQCLKIRHRMEEVVYIVFSLQPKDEVEGDLKQHCHARAGAVSLEALGYVTSKEEHPGNDNPDVERDVQGAIARIAELALALHEKEIEDEIRDEIIATYVANQRKVIRQRAKPSIKRLVTRREMMKKHASFANQTEEEDDEEGNKSTHSHVITTILSQTSALMHPLLMWKSTLPPELKALRQLCTDSIATLDDQAQTMTNTVAGWCLEDKRVDDFWMGQSANEVACSTSEVGELDAVVDEMAFVCQIFDRYLTLIAPEQAGKPVDAPTSAIQELHPEWTWKYASLERYLTTQQLQSALRLAHPVQIVLGTPIQVPSVVEDAQYLSTRALERAASARSTQAIGTVAHAIASNVWSTETTGGVHQALRDQQGCYKEIISEETSSSSPDSRANSSTFASALLGALDEDLASTRRMDTCICALNGIHSASAACSSLVRFLDSLLPEDEVQKDDKTSTMIQLAREELFRFSVSYQNLLQFQVNVMVTTFCGSVQDASVYRGSHCIPILKYYLERDKYNLANAEELRAAEDDVRLNKQLIQPLQESNFLRQFEKCDPDVLIAICGELANILVELFLECITSQLIPKQFTDWGSLLFSKQVRTVQNYLSGLMEKASDQAIPILPQWEKLSQAVTVLQLEKPSDWAFYQNTSTLTQEELKSILSLRADFSDDAIVSVVAIAGESTHT